MTSSDDNPQNKNEVLSGPAPKPPQSIDLRIPMRYFASAVTVVTSALDTGDLFGLTVSAFISVSLEPPLVLISIRNESTATNLLTKAKRYCVNILSEEQAKIAEKFSLAGEDGRFDGLDYRFGKSGSPVIAGCIGYVDCKISTVLTLGDHTIFVGEAIDVSAVDKKPLLYLNRRYVRLENEKTNS